MIDASEWYRSILEERGIGVDMMEIRYKDRGATRQRQGHVKEVVMKQCQIPFPAAYLDAVKSTGVTRVNTIGRDNLKVTSLCKNNNNNNKASTSKVMRYTLSIQYKSQIKGSSALLGDGIDDRDRNSDL